MRRSTAAAVGTLTGAALIMAVRLSVAAPIVTAAPPDLIDTGANARATPPASRNGAERKKPSPSPSKQRDSEPPTDDTSNDSGDNGNGGGNASGLKDGRFTGKPATNPYGTVQVAVTVSDGKVTNAAASYPTAGQSASINAGAVPKLKEQTLEKQSAKIDAVSGATFTSEAYVTSLQAALDAARA
jgi:uncharacterized protein with FMN-binding domain